MLAGLTARRFSDHINTYGNFFPYLASKGIEVYSYDQRQDQTLSEWVVADFCAEDGESR